MRTYKRRNVKECIEPIEGVLGLCRLCLEETKESVPIFTNKSDICTVLATRILMCVGYEITREDCLPNAICTECHNKLNKYYEFRKKCDSTYIKLKNHLLAVQARTPKKLSAEQEEHKALLGSMSICPISQSVCPISQSVCPVRQSISPIDQTVCPIIQSVCSSSQSVSSISQSVYSINQPICSIIQSVCSSSRSRQSVSPISQSICSINQPVCSIIQSVCSSSQSVSPNSQSVCPISQPVCSIIHSVTQPLCAVSQSVNQLDSTNAQLHSTDNNQLNGTVGQSDWTISQSDTSLDSHLVTMSRDQLMLAFEKPLEIVQTELQQNGLDSTLNIWMDGAVDKNVEDIPQEPSQTKPTELCPDVTEFLCSILVEMGILKRHQNELQMIEEYRTIQVETGDCRQITLEFVQIEEEQSTPTTMINNKTKENGKTINEVTKKKNERPRCPECGREFSTRAVLKRHLRTHTGERPFRCASCGLSFTQREVLTRHALVHRPVRPFACARCPKSFTQRGALAAHARRHAPADPAPVHDCALCPKRFLHASGLSRHMKAHLGRVWQCGACGKHFSDDSALRRHRRLKHEPHHAHQPHQTHQPPQEI
ncbi:zinc finger and SCAN domain-containing protein 12-like isoform X2 [Maniola jurtina]|uniref:zinc finger and SCAN domain-containing protein 12-like isoform X2 n=1 Tax=Maniola jurtina TaxID=191418 RepID=UPI001E686E80|nr:zinc finger and SCAN domain-containing protein 12-like isoform X2 [Maniola jurtina]